MSEEFVLKTVDLTKHYGGVHALEGANFELRKGEHVAIMGDNGAGKSTFVRQIDPRKSVSGPGGVFACCGGPKNYRFVYCLENVPQTVSDTLYKCFLWMFPSI